MGKYQVEKSIEEINQKIKSGKVVVVTAEEMVDIVRSEGEVNAAKRVDVVTTGTFGPMCSSGAFFNFGHSTPKIRASRVLLNNVPAYSGIAAVDFYLGVTEPSLDDPLNKVYPGHFPYGGGHVIQDLVAGERVEFVAESYGTDCYPSKVLKKKMGLKDFPYAMLLNPRNAYQNYNVGVNLGKKTIYTYMGVLRPNLQNANYCSAGVLSPLFNDPYFRTIGLGTRIFLGGGEGYVIWHGTQHNPKPVRGEKGVPMVPAGTLSVMGELKKMSPKFLVGVSLMGYGSSMAVGVGVPIPILNEEMAYHTSVSDEEITAQIVDYSVDYPQGTGKTLGTTTYAALKSGTIVLNGKEIQTVPLSSFVKAREIADILKDWIVKGNFYLTEPQVLIPSKK
ncbi:MAG: homocysteine biosynthesis protein [Deltaproteobacteria bacterium]|uniref:Homocysteine biosynthesis protein n=1 Tax=Candidatus Zymogenus saltonus TaxID=2844893 RepID=A0A9D8KG42_9DELT|nr:homocysteine biosynthesis protein [Candidatus Zymogenus saltonus]